VMRAPSTLPSYLRDARYLHMGSINAAIVQVFASEGVIMETDEYKITYRDGSTQVVRASQQLVQEPWLVFQDDYTEVLRIQAADIESVRRADVADRKRPVNAHHPR
jgi:hypothetical protein